MPIGQTSLHKQSIRIPNVFTTRFRWILNQVFQLNLLCQVEKALSRVKEELLSKRYRYNTGLLMADVRKTLKWADGKEIKAQVEIQLLDLLGLKTDADLLPPPKAEKKKGDKKGGSKDEKKASGPGKEEESEEGAATIAELMKTKV